MATIFEMMRRSGRPLSVSLAQTGPGVGYRRTLDALRRANAEGLAMRAQVGARGIGALIGLEATINPLRGSASYQALAALPLADRVARLARPDVRRRVLADICDRPGGLRHPLERIFELGDPPDYEPGPSRSIAARAAASDERPEELLYDLLLAQGGGALLYMPVLNYFDGNLDAVAEMMDHPHTVPGLGDGGAHVGTICDASFPTSLLSFWGRDRPGRRFDVPWLVGRQCRATAVAVGLADRGLLAAGYKADINIIDFEHLQLRPPSIVHDLPAGGKRLLQGARGYRHTIVSGVETYRDGEPTGALPGRLVRGGRAGPTGSFRRAGPDQTSSPDPSNGLSDSTEER